MRVVDVRSSPLSPIHSVVISNLMRRSWKGFSADTKTTRNGVNMIMIWIRPGPRRLGNYQRIDVLRTRNIGTDQKKKSRYYRIQCIHRTAQNPSICTNMPHKYHPSRQDDNKDPYIGPCFGWHPQMPQDHFRTVVHYQMFDLNDRASIAEHSIRTEVQ